MGHEGLRRFDTRPEKLRIIRIPADPEVERTYDVIDNDLDQLKAAIGGGWIEVVHSRLLPRHEGVQLIMIVDEEGMVKRLPYNARAAQFYPGPTGIAGDAIIVGEALVSCEEQYYEPDIVGIPDNFEMIGVRA